MDKFFKILKYMNSDVNIKYLKTTYDACYLSSITMYWDLRLVCLPKL